MGTSGSLAELHDSRWMHEMRRGSGRAHPHEPGQLVLPQSLLLEELGGLGGLLAGVHKDQHLVLACARQHLQGMPPGSIPDQASQMQNLKIELLILHTEGESIKRCLANKQWQVFPCTRACKKEVRCCSWHAQGRKSLRG